MLEIAIQAELYPKAFVVSELDKVNNEVVCVDSTENLWSFKGTKNWHKGDMVVAIMSDNGTPDNLYDDYFVEVRYAGYTLGTCYYKFI